METHQTYENKLTICQVDLEKVNMCLLLLKYRDPSFLKCKLKCCSFMLICVCFGGADLVDIC